MARIRAIQTAKTTARPLAIEYLKTPEPTVRQARDRVLLNWRPSPRGLCERSRYSIEQLAHTEHGPAMFAKDFSIKDLERLAPLSNAYFNPTS